MRIVRAKKITSQKRKLHHPHLPPICSFLCVFPLCSLSFTLALLYPPLPPMFYFQCFSSTFLPPFSVLFSVFFLYAHFPLPSPSPPSNVLFSMFFLYPFCLPPMFYSQCFSFTLPSEVYYCECHICSVKYFPGDQEGNT